VRDWKYWAKVRLRLEHLQEQIRIVRKKAPQAKPRPRSAPWHGNAMTFETAAPVPTRNELQQAERRKARHRADVQRTSPRERRLVLHAEYIWTDSSYDKARYDWYSSPALIEYASGIYALELAANKDKAYMRRMTRMPYVPAEYDADTAAGKAAIPTPADQLECAHEEPNLGDRDDGAGFGVIVQGAVEIAREEWRGFQVEDHDMPYIKGFSIQVLTNLATPKAPTRSGKKCRRGVGGRAAVHKIVMFDSRRPVSGDFLVISMGTSVPLKHRKLHSYFGLRKNAGLQSLRSRAPASDRDRLNPWRPGSDAERSVWAQALDYLSPWQAASAATDTGSHPCRSEAL